MHRDALGRGRQVRERRLARRVRVGHLPVRERLFHQRHDLVRVDVADDRQRRVVGREIFVVEFDEVRALQAAEAFLRRERAVGMVAAVEQFAAQFGSQRAGLLFAFHERADGLRFCLASSSSGKRGCSAASVNRSSSLGKSLVRPLALTSIESGPLPASTLAPRKSVSSANCAALRLDVPRLSREAVVSARPGREPSKASPALMSRRKVTVGSRWFSTTKIFRPLGRMTCL